MLHRRPLSPRTSTMISGHHLLAVAALLLLLLSPTLSSPTLTVSPTTLTPTNRTVHIRWSGVSSPSDLDWLGIYSPPSSPDDHFIGYIFLSSTPSHLSSGAGNLSIPLVNLRAPYSIRIFRWTKDEINQKHHDHDQNPLPGTRHRLAIAGPIEFERPDAAEQVHLAFTDKEDEMRVMFVSGDRKEGFVKYGVEEGRMEGMVATEVATYGIGDMCMAPANTSLGWRDPGFVHDGVMKGLKKGTKYYYQVGSDSGGWSATRSFISRNSDSNETIAFLFGDMGTYAPYNTFYRLQDESVTTVKWILRDIEALGEKPAFVSHIGDLSYARGFSWIWDEFFNQIEPIASQLPYHVCMGNHEYDWPSQPWRPSWSLGVYGTDGGGECGVPYSVKFKMPGNSSTPTGTGSPDTGNLYYSFDDGVVHFLYISTETNFLQGSDQYKFIKADLESVNRDKTPFVVVQGHRPMYTTSNELRDAPMRERMLEHLEPLLVDNNVTLALWGHVHRYERFCPMRNYICFDAATNGSESGGAPIHVVIGMAGQDWQPIWEPRPTHPDVPIFPQPERSMYRGGEFGYTRLVATREKLTLTYVGNHDGEMHDIVEIPSGRYKKDERDEVVIESTPFSLYVQGGSILLLGAFVGYALGFVTRYRKDSLQRSTWTPVKVEEA